MTDDDGKFTENFMEWAQETVHLTQENWDYGANRVVVKIAADIAHSRAPFPPATPRIFVAMCFPPEVPNHLKDHRAGASKMSHTSFRDPNHPDYTPVKGIESDDMKARKLEKGNETLSRLKDLL